MTAFADDGEQPASPSSGVLGSTARQLLVLVVIIAVAAALYAPAIEDYFQSDDFIFLRASRYAGFQTYVEESFDFTGYDRHDSVVDFLRDNDVAVPFLSYRPLYFVSLKVMNLAFGDDATGYHVVSLAVHVTNIVIVWLIAKRLLSGSVAPLLAAAIFALHPAYVDSVAWISDIATPGSTLFALLALYLFMVSIRTERTNLVLYACSVVSALAAVLFHQETIPWAGVIVAYGFMNEFRRGAGLPYQRAWDLSVPFLAIIVGAIALNSYITANTPVHEGSLGFGSHMVTHFKDLGAGSVYPVPTANDAAQTGALVGLFLVLLGTPLLWLLLRDRRSLYSSLFCLLWFVAALLPLLTLDDFFEPGVFFRKLYVVGPSLSIMLALAAQGFARLFRVDRYRVLSLAACIAIFLPLAASVYWAGERREDVSDRAELWERYVNELRDRYPTLPEGTTIYVVYPPDETRSFGDVYIIASAQALYGRVDARVVDRWGVGGVKPSIYERIFRYPGGTETQATP